MFIYHIVTRIVVVSGILIVTVFVIVTRIVYKVCIVCYSVILFHF